MSAKRGAPRPRELSLQTLRVGMPGISPAVGESLEEAAVVCLESQEHVSGVVMPVSGSIRRKLSLTWKAGTKQMEKTWADTQEATEHGACGLGVLLVHEFTPFTVAERSRKGTGFDYWLGRKGEPNGLFQKKGRLEVSGILRGGEREINARTKAKLRQAETGGVRLPLLVAIVEFGGPCSKVVNRWNE